MVSETNQNNWGAIAHISLLNVHDSRRFDKVTQAFVSVVARIEVGRYFAEIAADVGQVNPAVDVTSAIVHSKYVNLSQAAMNALFVLRSPNPKTVTPCSRMRDASRVKSLSLETMQKVEKRPV
jgi:hypothetical protein